MLIASWLACASAPAPPTPVPAPADPAPSAAAVVVKPALRRAEWAAARCNDGTPFAWTFRRGAGDTWVINLSGGYFCDDERAPCSERKPRLRTTRAEGDGEPARSKGEGIFSTDPAENPTFAQANQVDAHYCSSDLWLGDATDRRPTTGDPEQGWYFSGRENVRVLLEGLRALHGLDDADPDTRVLLLGTSAGGAGVVGNLDQFLAALPRTAADGRLKVVLDGSWVPTLPPEVTLPDAARWGPVHPACDRDARAAGGRPRDCVYGTRWWPYVAATGVPVLVQLSGLDRTQTPVFGVEGPEAERAWQARVHGELSALPWVFSGGHAYHVVAIDAAFGKGPEGRSFREVLDRFWAGGPPEQVFFRYP